MYQIAEEVRAPYGMKLFCKVDIGFQTDSFNSSIITQMLSFRALGMRAGRTGVNSK